MRILSNARLFMVVLPLAIIATAEPPKPNAAERALAARVKCEDFTKNPDGTWTTGPHATIDGNVFSGTFGIHGMMLDGADLAIVLDQKCGGERL